MNKKGFTLIEMLVVIAIIAVLVAIVIPTVSNSTEKAREATDAANIRAIISEVSITGMTNNQNVTKEYKMTQTGDFITTEMSTIAGVKPADIAGDNVTVVITYTASTGNVTVAKKAA